MLHHGIDFKLKTTKTEIQKTTQTISIKGRNRWKINFINRPAGMMIVLET